MLPSTAEIRSAEMGVDMFQERVAVNRVDVGGVLSYEFDFVAARLYFEVGDVGVARDVDVLEQSAVFSLGRQHPGNAL